VLLLLALPRVCCYYSFWRSILLGGGVMVNCDCACNALLV